MASVALHTCTRIPQIQSSHTCTMASILLGLVLYAVSLRHDRCCCDTYADSPCSSTALFGRSSSTADDDFFNEPSTMRPRLTAAAALKDDDGLPLTESSNNMDHFYGFTARGTRTIYRAAPMA